MFIKNNFNSSVNIKKNILFTYIKNKIKINTHMLWLKEKRRILQQTTVLD